MVEPAGDSPEEGPRPHRAPAYLALGFVAILLTTLVWMVYGPGLSGGYALVGIPLLVAIPLAIGGLISVAIDPRGRRSPAGCALYPALLLIGATLIAGLFFQEGVICIAMVLVLWVPVAIAGTLVNRWLRRRRRHDDDEDAGTIFRTSAWATLPMLAFAIDAAVPLEWQRHAVVREVVLPGSADEVWPLLLSIPDIRPGEGRPTFTHDVLGVPRPTQAQLVREDGALIRKATWGGDTRFEERVTEIRPSRAIGWHFAFPDDSIQRHTDRHIAPQGPYLNIRSGRYDLSSAGSGCTRLRLTTTYDSRVRLSSYFTWWGDRLLGDVEANVLTIIADRVKARNRMDHPAGRCPA